MLIEGKDNLCPESLQLFNKCMAKGQHPQAWNYANMHPIPKPNDIHDIPDNYRPIAISSCQSRLFERLLAKRLQQYCYQSKMFDNNQY